MTLRDLYLICFAAASVIHGVQTVLAAKLLRHRRDEFTAALYGVLIGATTFAWQLGNFLAIAGSTVSSDGAPHGYSEVFWIGNLFRDTSLVCFPLLFSYMCLHIPSPQGPGRLLLEWARSLRYPLWPWTIAAVAGMATADLGIRFSIFDPGLAAQVTLHIMLFYFVVFAVSSASYRGHVKSSGVAAHLRAYRATLIASLLGVATFVLMLTGYWRFPVPFLPYIELAAMLTSVPFTIAVAYRLYQFPFMDAFVREVVAGVILLATFVAVLSVAHSVVWWAACGAAIAYSKGPLTRWVERTFLGYEESIEKQEERIGNAIRALTRLDEFGARISEVLSTELDAAWIEISSNARSDAAHRFEIPGSGLWLYLGPRIGGRRYMSRHLSVARSAALQLAAHRHQLEQHELRDLTARAQMRALQAQINPHFLFNTLNVLANLIHSNPEKAERVTEELADIFRYALESTRVEWVTMDDELQFLQSYLEIEKARFEERLSYLFDVDSAIRSLKIPPMILQPLVENAIKHGIGPKVEGGSVRIFGRLESDRVVIVVEDTGAGQHSGSRHRGAGIGLSNVRERLQHLYGDESSLKLEDVTPSGTRAVLILPQLVGAHS